MEMRILQNLDVEKIEGKNEQVYKNRDEERNRVVKNDKCGWSQQSILFLRSY